MGFWKTWHLSYLDVGIFPDLTQKCLWQHWRNQVKGRTKFFTEAGRERWIESSSIVIFLRRCINWFWLLPNSCIKRTLYYLAYFLLWEPVWIKVLSWIWVVGYVLTGFGRRPVSCPGQASRFWSTWFTSRLIISKFLGPQNCSLTSLTCKSICLLFRNEYIQVQSVTELFRTESNIL